MGNTEPHGHTHSHPRYRGVLHRIGESPVYYECPTCGFLTADQRFGDGKGDCPVCGTHPDARRLFPADRLRKLDARVRRYHAEGEDEIVVILAATFLESLFEDVLSRILSAHGADVAVQQVVFDAQRSVGQRLSRLFPVLTGEQFEDAAAEVGYREFPLRWRTLRATRNSFIHDAPFSPLTSELDKQHSNEAMLLLDQAYHLFVLLNNVFAAEERARRLRHA